MRLDKKLSNSGLGTRKEIRKLVSSLKIKVNDVIIKDVSYQVNESDVIKLNDEIIETKDYLTYAFDKPDSCLSAMSDQRLTNIGDFIPDNLKTKGLSPVGRLDYHTTGLIILTNDGELSHRLTSPKYNIPKVYEVNYKGEPLTTSHIEELSSGLILNDMDKETILKPCKLELLSNNICRLTLLEGKTHEVRRIISHFNREVITLKRLSIGNISIPSCDGNGKLYQIDHTELLKLRNLCGLE